MIAYRLFWMICAPFLLYAETSLAIYHEGAFDINIKAVRQVIESQIDTIRSGDVARAYFSYTTVDFRKITSLDDFKKFVESFPVLSNNQSFEVDDITFQHGIAVCQGRLFAADGSMLYAEYELKQEDDDWKIQGVQLFKTPVSKS